MDRGIIDNYCINRIAGSMPQNPLTSRTAHGPAAVGTANRHSGGKGSASPQEAAEPAAQELEKSIAEPGG